MRSRDLDDLAVAAHDGQTYRSRCEQTSDPSALVRQAAGSVVRCGDIGTSSGSGQAPGRLTAAWAYSLSVSSVV